MIRHRGICGRAALALTVAMAVAGCSPYRTIAVKHGDEALDLQGKRVKIETGSGQEIAGRVVEAMPGSLVIEATAPETAFGGGAPVRTTVELAAGDTIRVEGLQTLAKVTALTVVGTIVYIVVSFVGGVGQMGGS